MKKASKKIVGITGSSGALGKNFIKTYKNIYKIVLYKKDIQDTDCFQKWINKNNNINIFIHFAALSTIRSSNKDFNKTIKINTKATINILKILNKSKLKNLKYFLFSSSSHVYKPSFAKLTENSKRIPVNAYGKSKKQAEDFIIKYKKIFRFKIGIARIFNFYSKDHKDGFFIYDLIKKLKSTNKNIHLKRINTVRDFININQLCDILNFMIIKKIGMPLNIGSSKGLNLIDLSKMIIKKKRIKKNITFEKKIYPGFNSNINLLRKLGYKKKIIQF